ncbi:hypothetical protein [Glycomyces salinus]|uniref:hypothetical protein n=1 Tax=Glycomyces salinus TaxID=980294 RepID=UPI0018EB653C|nr:hypothetical protein [Glycomyces salinus]
MPEDTPCRQLRLGLWLLGLGGRAKDDRALQIIDVFKRGKAEQPFKPIDTARGLKGRGASGRAAYGFRFQMNKTSAAERVMTIDSGGRRFTAFQQRWNDVKIEHRGDTENWIWEENPDTAYYASTVAVRLPMPSTFVCVTKRWRGAVSGFVGQDTTLEHHRFNREYLAFAEHARFGHDILHQGLMDWVMLRQPPVGTFLVVADGWCYISKEDIFKSAELDERLNLLNEFAALIPDHVWNVDYGLAPKDIP